jgi:hypothetical protein
MISPHLPCTQPCSTERPSDDDQATDVSSGSGCDDIVCGWCMSGDDGDVLVVCDNPECYFGAHIYCIPACFGGPLDAVPPGNWFCSHECGIKVLGHTIPPYFLSHFLYECIMVRCIL